MGMVLSLSRNSTSSPRYVFYVTDENQAWFWTEEWQRGEDMVDDYIQRGEFEEFNNMDDFLRSLGFNE